MGRIVQKHAVRGSQRWLQQLIESNSEVLDRAIGFGHLTWLSPLASDNYAEYNDKAFLERLDIRLQRRPLASFWPTGGPHWDGLARTRDNICVIIEAKAHVSEMSSSCRASSPASIQKIRSALNETKAVMGVAISQNWLEGYYQYVNRLAHAYLLHEINGILTKLVFIYFVGDKDMRGPVSQKEWISAIARAHEALGIKSGLPTYIHDVFIDVRAVG